MDNRFGWDLPPGVSVNDIPGNEPPKIKRRKKRKQQIIAPPQEGEKR